MELRAYVWEQRSVFTVFHLGGKSLFPEQTVINAESTRPEQA